MKSVAFGVLALAACLGGSASAQVYDGVTNEVLKTKEADVVISDVRYRGQDDNYPFVRTAGGNQGGPLCTAARERFQDEAAPSKLSVETMLLTAAGSSLTEPLETQRAKIAGWWPKADLSCDPFFSGGNHFLPLLIEGNTNGWRIVDKIILRYSLPLNDVASDGRTLLDTVADRIDANEPGRSSLVRIYGALRRFGAKHRKELEAEGSMPDAREAQARIVAERRAAAARGDLDAMAYLIMALHSGDNIAANPAEAAQWVERYEAAVLASGDAERQAFLARRFTGDYPSAGAYPLDRQRAVRLFRLAAAQRNPDALEGLADALWGGSGAPQDRAAAVAIYKEMWTDRQPMNRVGDYYAALGDLRTAAVYYRTAMRWTPGLMDGNDGYPQAIAWMRRNGFSPCGPLAGDQEPWTVEDQWGGC